MKKAAAQICSLSCDECGTEIEKCGDCGELFEQDIYLFCDVEGIFNSRDPNGLAHFCTRCGRKKKRKAREGPGALKQNQIL